MRKEYDEYFILEQVSAGKTRDEISNELGHKSYRGHYKFMKEKGYKWSKEKGNFEKTATILTPSDILNFVPTGIAGQVITAFQNEKDSKIVASSTGFATSREMALFMKEQGYDWANETHNYKVQGYTAHVENSGKKRSASLKDTLKENHDFFEYLVSRENEIKSILDTSYYARIPSYKISGKTHSKSIQISPHLNKVFLSYINENKCKQAEVIQVALIEFLIKYGYAENVKALVG
jgi:hypothetical protein